MSKAALTLRGLERTYATEGEELHVLTGVDLELQSGELVGLVGPSGSGKSSLLHAAALLEHPNAGQVLIGGRDGFAMSESERTRLRRDEIGFVYQFHHLLAELDALENVALPARIAGMSDRAAKDAARERLTLLGLGERLTHRPGQLSGGEQQRVAIARALANSPSLLLADEPTGNLDPATSDQVFDALRTACRETGAAALVATHNIALAERMDRVVTLENGKLTSWTAAA
jgi:lipoprotein-releasing system ATP-binding protein